VYPSIVTRHPPQPTERLLFRTWTSGDFAIARELWGDARVTRFVGGQLDEERVRDRLEYEIALEREHGIQYWPIFLRSNEHVGCCGLRPYEPSEAALELGFHIRYALWGKGFASEAARSAIAHAFDVIGTKELVAGHHPDNTDSKHVLEKLGFVYARAEPYAPTGLVHPTYVLRPSH
jgi:RimJ/RimL family protein N-acetyltransferase